MSITSDAKAYSLSTLKVDTTYVTIGNGGAIDDNCDAFFELTTLISDWCSLENLEVAIHLVLAHSNDNIPLTSIGATANGDDTAVASWKSSSAWSIGAYQLILEIDDGCGHITTKEVAFEIKDMKAPMPNCHDGIRADLQPTEDGGIATVWATDFIKMDIGDCTGQDSTQIILDSLSGNTANRIAQNAYSIYRVQNFNAFNDSLYISPFRDTTKRSITFTCEDYYDTSGFVPLRIYAEDEAGNKGYCNTFLQLENNSGACGYIEGGQIYGTITTENNQPVAGAIIELSGGRSSLFYTDPNGNYIFPLLLSGRDYRIRPTKEDFDLNGITTFDLILIQKHILGKQMLDSPYKMIAADVNNSQSITTLDLIELRKLILNIDDALAHNSSWRFVDADYISPDPLDPWATPFPESKSTDLLNNTLSFEANFIGIKIGDVNSSAKNLNAQNVILRQKE